MFDGAGKLKEQRFVKFTSDNASGIAPEILDAIAKANHGMATAYGDDEITKKLTATFAKLFETDVTVFVVGTGTAANSLALASLTPPYGAVMAHHEAHIYDDECGAPEMFTAGAKIVGVDGAHGKIDPAALKQTLKKFVAGNVHHVQPTSLSITQATEAGTVYQPGEISELVAIARSRGLSVHMDGARFANALAGLNCSPADISWKLGVDVLSFGATKNGALGAEALVFFKPELAHGMAFRRKRAGHLISKMRFVSAQFEAYLQEGLWLELAAHANAEAAYLAEGLAGLSEVTLRHPVQANELFVTLPDDKIAALRTAGALFHPWPGPGDGEGRSSVRLVTCFATERTEIDEFLGVLEGA